MQAILMRAVMQTDLSMDHKKSSLRHLVTPYDHEIMYLSWNITGFHLCYNNMWKYQLLMVGAIFTCEIPFGNHYMVPYE